MCVCVRVCKCACVSDDRNPELSSEFCTHAHAHVQTYTNHRHKVSGKFAGKVTFAT